jgi:hypothetical protein
VEGHRQNRDRNPLLHHQLGARCDAAEPLHSPTQGIENKLHRVLDVGLGEGLDRKRVGVVAQNFSVLNRVALNLIKQDKTSKRGIHGNGLMTGWDNDYLLHLLGN